MTQLTEQEHAAMDQNRAMMQAPDWPPELTFVGRVLADEFRTYFTDVDDITLARVLLVVGGKLASLGLSSVMLGTPVSEALTVRLGVLFGTAATELAAVELDCPGDGQ